MIERFLNLGTTGQIKLIDHTDNSEKDFVEMWYKADPPIFRRQMAYTSSVDGAQQRWNIFTWQALTDWYRLGARHAGGADTFTFHFRDSGTIELGGDVDFTIQLLGASGTNLVEVRVDGVWKKATPFVKSGGVWIQPTPYLKVNGVWKEIL